MNGYVFDPARMYIYLLTKEFVYHRRTFQMPTGEPFAPWRFPPKLAARSCALPECKVVHAAFLIVCRNESNAWFVRVYTAKSAIVRKARRIKVNAALDVIGVSFFYEGLDYRNHCRHMVTCARKLDFLNGDI